MKITIGRFDEDGEPVWFEVETNVWKDENGNWKKEDEDKPIRMDNEAEVDKATGGYATTHIERVKDGESDVL